MARESFTLLNLTDTESESVPDLDLVLPAARKQIKRKVGKNMEKIAWNNSTSTVRYCRYQTYEWQIIFMNYTVRYRYLPHIVQKIQV